MANFKTGAIFFGAFAAIQYYREDRPAARAYLQRYYLLLRTTVKYRLHLHEEWNFFSAKLNFAISETQ